MNATGKGGWVRGQSGNPAGRPKYGDSATDILRGLVDKQEMGNKLIELARGGNVAALKYVYDRLDGAPRQALELSGPGEEPIGLLFVRPNEVAEDSTTTSTG